MNSIIKQLTARDKVTVCFLSASIVAFIALHVSLPLSNTSQIIVVVTLVILLGLPHGALDVELAKKLELINSAKKSIRFFSGYLFLVLLGVITWLFLPTLALILFLGISVHHFSDDWSATVPRHLSPVIGFCVIGMPTLRYSEDVFDVFLLLLVPAPQAAIIVNILYLGSLAGFLIIIIGFTLNRYFSFLVTGELLTLSALAIALPPLLYFTVYFCFLHSVRHLLDCAEKLEISSLRCYRKSLPILILTLIVAGLSFILFHSEEIPQDMIRWLFIGLFALTIPHVCLITFWYRSRVYNRQG